MATTAGLIGGAYSVDFARPLAGVGVAGPAYAAISSGGAGPFMALEAVRGRSLRAGVLMALSGSTIRYILTPLAHGPAAKPDGGRGYYVICSAPPGPPLDSALRPWTEAELLNDLLRPVAAALALLHAKGLTHRGIRPGNLFQPARQMPVTLGSAWAAPPAMDQPGWLEPPSSAACAPHCRGEGTPADDIFALGACMLMLAIGRNPAEGLNDDDALFQKLETGSFAALAAGHRLPASLAELLRGMLADEPDNRPSAGMLANPAACRARRLSGGYVHRANRPFLLGGRALHTAPSVALAILRNPAEGVKALRLGAVDHWLRTALSDVATASRIGIALRQATPSRLGGARVEADLVAQAVKILQPLGPPVYRTIALYPDALGPALEHALMHRPAEVPGLVAVAQDLGVGLPRDRGQVTARPPNGWRLAYNLNPLMPCASPIVAESWVVRLTELLPALERANDWLSRPGAALDAPLLEFVLARQDERSPIEMRATATDQLGTTGLEQIRLLARLHQRVGASPCPRLAGWALAMLQPGIATYRSRTRREQIAARLAQLATDGDLPALINLIEDGTEQANDAAGFADATASLAAIEQRLSRIESGGALRAQQARHLAEQVAYGAGALACLAGLAFAVLP